MASARFCTQLIQMISAHFQIARLFLRISHCNGHGVRKGSGIHASSATTVPPSFVAVAARGEWSIGKVLDVYFKFGMAGDQYLGRLLALLDPNDDSFAVLPPHWKDPKHPTVLRGLRVAFRGILEKHQDAVHDPTGLLLLLLASIVHHSPWIKSICSKYPDHAFHKLALFDQPELLAELKNEHLTLEPTPQVPVATGVPPHIDHTIKLKAVFDMLIKIDSKIDEYDKTLSKSVHEAIDKKVSEEGGVNSTILSNALTKLKDEILARIDANLSGAPRALPDNNITEPLPVVEDDVQIATPFSFKYKGSVWCIPQSFMFPRDVTRLVGWRKWLVGSVHIEGGRMWKIKPYRFFIPKDFHSQQLRNLFNIEWKPIFSRMMETPGLKIPADVDDAFVESSYASTTTFLREKYSYIFSGPEGSTDNFLIGTWSRKIRRSHVLKHGTVEDIRNLPDPGPRNRSKPPGIVRQLGPLRKKRKCPPRGKSRQSVIQELGDGPEEINEEGEGT